MMKIPGPTFTAKPQPALLFLSVLAVLMFIHSFTAWAWDPPGVKVIRVEPKSGRIVGLVRVKEISYIDKSGTHITTGSKFEYTNESGATITRKISLESPFGDVWMRDKKVFVNCKGQSMVVDMMNGTINYHRGDLEKFRTTAPFGAPHSGLSRGKGTNISWCFVDKDGKETPIKLPLTFEGRKVELWPLMTLGSPHMVIAILVCQCTGDSWECGKGHGALVCIDGSTGLISKVFAGGLKVYLSRGYGMWTDPQVAVASDLALVQDKTSLRAIDMKSGKTAWTTSSAGLKGRPWDTAWQSGKWLYVMAGTIRGKT